MAQQNQILKPRSINLDSAKKYLKDSEAAYLLNFDVQNPSAIGKGVPFAANMPLCEMDLPQGENYNNGRYYSPITNEEYCTQVTQSSVPIPEVLTRLPS